MSTNFLFFIILFAALNPIFAQDNHYNSQQFGARAGLLGGSVIGGLEDNSSMYYNPGAMVFAESNNLTIHTNIHSVEYVLMKNGLGENVESFSLRYIPLPQEISAIVTGNPQKKLRIGYTILNKSVNNNDFSQRKNYFADLNPDYEGEEYYVGQLDMQNVIVERWAGVCASYKVSEKFSIGFTPFGSYRSQRYLYNLYSMLSTGNAAANQTVAYQQYYDVLRTNIINLFVKGGLHYRTRNWRFGLTFTTPSIRIWGKARAERQISFFGMDRENVVYDDRQRYIKGRFKQPVNLGIGLMNVTNYYRLSFSAVYHHAVADYRMAESEMRPVVFPSPVNSEAIDFLGFRHRADAVLNFSLGYEYKFNDKWKIHSSLRTDFATQRKRNEISIVDMAGPRLVNPSTDIYHASMGFSIRRELSVLTAGVTYSLGWLDNVMQHADFNAPVYPVNLWGFPQNRAGLRHHILTLTFGYTYYFDTLSLEKEKSKNAN